MNTWAQTESGIRVAADRLRHACLRERPGERPQLDNATDTVRPFLLRVGAHSGRPESGETKYTMGVLRIAL